MERYNCLNNNLILKSFDVKIWLTQILKFLKEPALICLNS